MTDELFSVAIFYADDTWEYVRRGISAKEAVEAAKLHTATVGARMGMVRRVIITDDGDFTNFEWKYGEGVTYPKEPSQRACREEALK